MKRLLRAGAVVASTLLAGKGSTLRVGVAAPHFTAPSTMGQIELGRVLEAGAVILALYYADFTSG